MKKLQLLLITLLTVSVSEAWAEVSFKADTPYLMIQKRSSKYVNMNSLNTNATLSDSWSLIYFTESDGGYIVSDGTNKISAEGYHAFVRASLSTVWTISEVDGVVNGYKLYQNTSGNSGYFGSDEYNEGKPCFCDKAENHESTTFVIIEANVYVRLLELKTIPALYSSSDINQATTMIIGTALTTSQQESILETIYSSAEGKKFYAVNNNLRGNYMTVGESNVSLKTTSLTADAIMEVEYAGDGKYYLKGVTSNKYAGAPANPPLTYSTTAEATAFYIDNYAKTTDNMVYFAKTKTNSNDEALHYHNSYTTWVTNWKYSTDPSQWIITAISDEEYTALSSASEETLNYTLTDENGATYSGTITGTLGVNPSFTGCNGYTLSNPIWNISTKTFTADVTFPFKISSNSKTNYTYIGSYQSDNFYWYAASSSATVVNAQYQNAPTNQSGEIEKYEWAIIPSCTNGAFTFTIKNAKTGTYVTSTSTAKKHDTKVEASPTVSLSSTGTAFTYASNKQWCLPTTLDNDGSTPLYLSLNSSGTTSGLQYLGTWISHGGTKVSYYGPDDFTSLIADLTTTRNTASSYTVGNRIGEFVEASSGTMATALSNADGIINGTAYGTNRMITGYKTALETAISGLSLNMPESGPIFMRIRSSQGAKGYLTAANAGGRATFTSATDASTIYLWASDKKLIAYGNGLAYAEVYQPQADGADGKEFNIVSAVSGNFGQYSIYSTYSGSVGNVYLYSTGSGNADRNTYSDGFKQQNSFTLEAVDQLPVTISDAKYATLYSPVALEVPSGVTAYVASDRGTYLSLTAIEGSPAIIKANTGVILYADVNVATTYNFTITTGGTETSELTGTVATINRPDYSYVLSRGDNGLGFYAKGTSGSSKIPGFKAYYQGESGESGVKSFRFNDEDAIGSVLAEDMGRVECYDLSGRRVNAPVRGLYIVNGKKVLVK